MSTFHHFSRLPSELRSRIWELSIEPRDVVLRHAPSRVPTWRSPTPPLAAMQVCRESHSVIQGFYDKAFVNVQAPSATVARGSGLERYIRINFNIDTICVRQSSPPFLTEWPESAKVRRLKVELWDDEYFWPGRCVGKADGQYLVDFKRLEFLTIVYQQAGIGLSPTWLDEFYDMMAEYYYTCNQVPFDTRVVHADPKNGELTRYNFVKKDYEETRQSWQEGRDFREDPNEPFPETNSFPWTHVGCDCKDVAATQSRWRFRTAPSWQDI